MSSDISRFAVKHAADADVLHTIGKSVPGEHTPPPVPPRSLAAAPLIDGPSRQEVLVERAHQGKKFVLEERARERAEKLHGHSNGMISDQHSDEANVRGIRNIN